MPFDLSLPHLVWLIIAFLVLESLAVCGWRARAGRSDWYTPLATNLAGICLLLALGAALDDAGNVPILASLTGALVAHILDLRLRMPSAGTPTKTA
jgi:heme A synthase